MPARSSASPRPPSPTASACWRAISAPSSSSAGAAARSSIKLIPSAPDIEIGGLQVIFFDPVNYYCPCLIVVSISLLILYRPERSRIGLTFHAIHWKKPFFAALRSSVDSSARPADSGISSRSSSSSVSLLRSGGALAGIRKPVRYRRRDPLPRHTAALPAEAGHGRAFPPVRPRRRRPPRHGRRLPAHLAPRHPKGEVRRPKNQHPVPRAPRIHLIPAHLRGGGAARPRTRQAVPSVPIPLFISGPCRRLCAEAWPGPEDQQGAVDAAFDRLRRGRGTNQGLAASAVCAVT